MRERTQRRSRRDRSQPRPLDYGLTRREVSRLRSLHPAWRIQRFLDGLVYDVAVDEVDVGDRPEDLVAGWIQLSALLEHDSHEALELRFLAESDYLADAATSRKSTGCATTRPAAG